MTRALLMSLTRHAAVAGEKEKRAVLYTYCILLVGPHCLGSVRESTYQPQQQLTCNINGDFSFPRMSFAIKTTFKGAATIHSFTAAIIERGKGISTRFASYRPGRRRSSFYSRDTCTHFTRHFHCVYLLTLCESCHII